MLAKMKCDYYGMRQINTTGFDAYQYNVNPIIVFVITQGRSVYLLLVRNDLRFSRETCEKGLTPLKWENFLTSRYRRFVELNNYIRPWVIRLSLFNTCINFIEKGSSASPLANYINVIGLFFTTL